MARPRKNRIVGAIPGSEGFVPLGCIQGQCGEPVIMTVEEYETLRLIDYLKLTQEECAARMEVSRPTVTGIYEAARFKIADALVNEKLLLIEGGSFDFSREHKKTARIEKENTKMKIAVTYENGQIFQHFGHCQNFKIYEVEDGKVLSSQVINAAGSGHGALAGFLRSAGVEMLICGGIGGGAQMALAQIGIRLFAGISGDADAAVDALLAGTLQYSENPTCDHHGHGEGHSCHSHGEGHSCGGGKCHQ